MFGPMILACAVLYLDRGLKAPAIWDNDGAYYYGVARHIARTGRLAEPIVWHFLAPPKDPNAPALVVGVWMGNSDNTPDTDTLSLGSSAPLWSK